MQPGLLNEPHNLSNCKIDQNMCSFGTGTGSKLRCLWIQQGQHVGNTSSAAWLDVNILKGAFSQGKLRCSCEPVKLQSHLIDGQIYEIAPLSRSSLCYSNRDAFEGMILGWIGTGYLELGWCWSWDVWQDNDAGILQSLCCHFSQLVCHSGISYQQSHTTITVFVKKKKKKKKKRSLWPLVQNFVSLFLYYHWFIA